MKKPSVERALTALKSNVLNGTWKPGTKLPSAGEMSSVLGVCRQTLKIALEIMKSQKLLDDQGSLGLYVMNPSLQILHQENKQLFFAMMAEKSLEAVKYQAEGGVVLDKYIVLTKNHEVLAVDLTTGAKIKMTVDEIEDTLFNPVSVEELVKLSGSALARARKKFNRQKELSAVATVIHKNREKLNIQWRR